MYFIKNKSDTFDQFVKYKLLLKNQSGKKLKILRSDRGGKYLNADMHNYLAENGIHHETTTADTPQQNGVAERFNRTLIESVRALIHASAIPKNLWAEISSTAAYIWNRTPTNANKGLTPFERWFGTKPDISHLRIIWSDAYAHVQKSQRYSKLAPQARKLKLILDINKTKRHIDFGIQNMAASTRATM